MLLNHLLHLRLVVPALSLPNRFLTESFISVFNLGIQLHLDLAKLALEPLGSSGDRRVGVRLRFEIDNFDLESLDLLLQGGL